MSSCILTRGTKVEKLSTFDIEYLFLNVRGKSVGEQIEVMVTCPDDGKTQVPTSINIDSIQVQKSENHNPHIKLDDTYTLVIVLVDVAYFERFIAKCKFGWSGCGVVIFGAE